MNNENSNSSTTGTVLDSNGFRAAAYPIVAAIITILTTFNIVKFDTSQSQTIINAVTTILAAIWLIIARIYVNKTSEDREHQITIINTEDYDPETTNDTYNENIELKKISESIVYPFKPRVKRSKDE